MKKIIKLDINFWQGESIRKMVKILHQAHFTDIKVRNNGQDVWFQADWLKKLFDVIEIEDNGKK